MELSVDWLFWKLILFHYVQTFHITTRNSRTKKFNILNNNTLKILLYKTLYNVIAVSTFHKLSSDLRMIMIKSYSKSVFL